ncbi:helix-turn-helix domain-containing protein [Marinomonas gallaica]|uniref:AraC family transcriptional regulator n=1 Tax=Marinomonas gallaica TaxID=1806667 RepID=UPI003A93CA4F
MSTSDRNTLPTAFWLGVDKLGVSRSQLVRMAGLPLSIGHTQSKVSTAQFFALWSALERLKSVDVGIELMTMLDRSVLPPSFLVAYHARTFRDALQRVVRFKSLCAPEELKLETDEPYIKVITHWIFAGDPPPSLTDATFSSIVALGRHGTETPLKNIKLELRRDKSEAVMAYFQCPIKWNAEQDALYLHTRELDLPFIKFNEELTSMLDNALNEQLNQHQVNSSYTEKVRWLLRKTLTAGRPELKAIARELAISERSLQRQLNNEGGSFQAILSDTRHELALDYLRNASYELSEIAYMLGYEDQASFFRAFQNWQHISPAKWRDAVLKPG